MEPRGERQGLARNVLVTETPSAEAVVVDEKFMGEVRELMKEIEQCVAGHPYHYGFGVGWRA
jgi:hypothetical protein